MKKFIWLVFVISYRMDFLSDLWNFMKTRKKFWLAPMLIVLLLLGILIVIGGAIAVSKVLSDHFAQCFRILTILIVAQQFRYFWRYPVKICEPAWVQRISVVGEASPTIQYRANQSC